MKVVRLIRRYERPLREHDNAGLYNVGETAGFPDAEADQLIAEGRAVEVPSDEATQQPNDDDV
jgi:hypothetical protein